MITQPGREPQSNATRQVNRDTQAHKTHLLRCSCWGKCLCDSGPGTNVALSMAKTSEKAQCKPHTTVTGCWWHPEGSPWGFLHPNNTSASEPRHLCSTAGLSGNEGSSKQVRYGAKHQTCTPCAVTARIRRKAGIISYSRCWIILLSETMVCFQGKQFQSPMVSLTLSPVPPLWVVLSTLPWHKWCPCAPSIPAVILERDWGAPLALSQPHSSQQPHCNHVILCSELWSQDTRHLTHGNGSLEKTGFALKFKTPVNYPPITLAQVLHKTA